MPEIYSAKEGLEHAELAHELLQRSEHAVLRFVPLMAAVLAVFAGLSSLYAGRLGEQMLALKNEAILSEVKAADLWTEYEAESIKAHLYEVAAGSGPVERARLKASAAKYRRQQVPLRAQALAHERDRDRDMALSNVVEDRKVGFDIALAFFEISIVLASIAAMVKRPFLFVMAAVGGALGLIYSIRDIMSGP